MLLAVARHPANRPFLLFSAAMIGSYVLSFQVYLALPLEVRRLGGDGEFGTAAVAGLFAVSGLLSTILGQTRVTRWCKARSCHRGPRPRPGASSDHGPGVRPAALAATALPVPADGLGRRSCFVPVPGSAVLFGLAMMIIYPFEMETIVPRRPAPGGHLLRALQHPGRHRYHPRQSAVRLGAGPRRLGAGLPSLPWLVMALIGMGCAAAVRALDRSGRLRPHPRRR